MKRRRLSVQLGEGVTWVARTPVGRDNLGYDFD
jgi:hypothetical protein